MARVLVPLPSRDFDPTEAAVSWKVLKRFGHDVAFATPNGAPAVADDIMVSGEGLDFWGRGGPLKRFTLVGSFLRADAEGRAAYGEMLHDAAYKSPHRWEEARVEHYDGLLLPGGHRARGMREYLESPILQKLVVGFFGAQKPVGAICHGVVLAARSVDPATGRSVLHDRKTTALTWALERSAWDITRYTRFWDPDYYRTYMEQPGETLGYRSVQAEVTRALVSARQFCDVPANDPHYRKKTSGMTRDRIDDATPAFVVRDRNYVSARWPGDTHTFAKTFAELLKR